MSIQLIQPYKIIPDKYKIYQEHYIIPAEQCLVVPIKALGEEVACDIHWLRNGELQVMHNAVFVSENLMRVELMEDEELYGLWKAYKIQLDDQ